MKRGREGKWRRAEEQGSVRRRDDEKEGKEEELKRREGGDERPGQWGAWGVAHGECRK